FFFLSSRRRHTRFSRDWSSDVCSSDLGRLNLVELRLLAGRAALVLAPGNFLHLSAADQVGQTDAAEEFMDAIAQIAPQVMSETGVTRMAVTLPLATGGVHRFIDRIDDFGDLNLVGVAGEVVAAPRTSHAGDQFIAPQLGEELFQVR